jgi:hypothetical protein
MSSLGNSIKISNQLLKACTNWINGYTKKYSEG